MARYKDYNYAQGQFITVDFASQIREGSFEFALNHIIDNELDLSSFDAEFKNDKTGAPAYDPRIMLKIIFYAYSLGIIKSRQIARECEVNIMFMALSANARPDHSTICSFLSGMGDKAEILFTKVLLLCDKLGLIGKNMFAIDGCKISSNASKEWSGKISDYERRKKKMEEEVRKLLKRHQELDEQKEDLKDQIDKEKKAIESYKKKIKKMSDFLKNNNDRISSAGTKIQSNITDPESGKLKSSNGMIQGYNGIAAVDAKHQVIVGTEILGEGNERPSVEPIINKIENNFNDSFKDGSLNTTIVTADTGFNSEKVLKLLDERGVDAYVPDPQFRKRDTKYAGRERYDRPTTRQGIKRKKFFSRDDFNYDEKKDEYICPAGNTLYRSGKPYKINNYIYQCYQGRESKCSCCSLRKKCIQGKSASRVKQLSIQIKNNRSKKHSDLMKEKIDTTKGRFIYSRRMGIVEPVFANICHTLKLKYFTMRGKFKVNTQWNLYATVHNMLKLFRYAPCLS